MKIIKKKNWKRVLLWNCRCVYVLKIWFSCLNLIQDKAFFVPLVTTEVKAGIQLLIADIWCSLRSPGIYSVWSPAAKRKGHQETCIKVSKILVYIYLHFHQWISSLVNKHSQIQIFSWSNVFHFSTNPFHFQGSVQFSKNMNFLRIWI